MAGARDRRRHCLDRGYRYCLDVDIRADDVLGCIEMESSLFGYRRENRCMACRIDGTGVAMTREIQQED